MKEERQLQLLREEQEEKGLLKEESAGSMPQWWWFTYDAVWRGSTGEVEECTVQLLIYTFQQVFHLLSTFVYFCLHLSFANQHPSFLDAPNLMYV